MRVVLVMCCLLSGCHLDDLLRRPDPIPEPKCSVSIYWYRLDPVTKARIDSSWAGTVDVPCPRRD